MTERPADLAILRCPVCASGAPLTWLPDRGTCRCGHEVLIDDGIVQYTPDAALERMPEVGARDQQAAGYLSHDKFPTQIARMEQFLSGVPAPVPECPALDLGCGPGPFTARLVHHGHRAVAVDFSARSLAVNRSALAASAQAVTFVRADLRALRLAPGSTTVLLMCDFLQHLGDEAARRQFLTRAFEWLRPGGRFYLSFFNINIKHQLTGDTRGSFSGGTIPYERLQPDAVRRALPDGVVVRSVTPLNIFHGATTDRLASMIPGAGWVARMIAIDGWKE